MPLYEFQCCIGHITEVLYLERMRPEKIICKHSVQEPESDLDLYCNREAELIVSLPTMKPDKHWNGTVTPTGDVVHSQEEYDAVMKNVVPATRENKEFVQKQAVIRKAEHEEKKKQRRDKFFDKLANEL